MQVLYQIDLRGEGDVEAIVGALNVEDAFDSTDVRAAAVKLAREAWADRNVADARVRELAPDWPTYRQPAVDRAILRLACFEMAAGRTPARVAINEAVELAKEYASAQSPAFINGVLDKIARTLPETAGELKP